MNFFGFFNFSLLYASGRYLLTSALKYHYQMSNKKSLGKLIFHSFLVTQEHLQINKTVPVSLLITKSIIV